MKNRVMKTVLCAACALAPLAAVPAGQAVAQTVISPAQDIALSIGRGQLVTVPGNMADIFVSNETVADVQVKSQRQLYVFGKAGGETTVYASNSAGDIIWSANVRVGSNLDSIDQMLALAMPEAKINVATMGTNTVLLTGTVAAPEDAAEAERLVAAFVGDGANVVSRLRMATPLQVNLRVRFAEVSRSLVRTLGANLLQQDTSGGFQFGVASGRAPSSNASRRTSSSGVMTSVSVIPGVATAAEIVRRASDVARSWRSSASSTAPSRDFDPSRVPTGMIAMTTGFASGPTSPVMRRAPARRRRSGPGPHRRT